MYPKSFHRGDVVSSSVSGDVLPNSFCTDHEKEHDGAIELVSFSMKGERSVFNGGKCIRNRPLFAFV